ncbi:MAG: methyltransferase domain-containing protein [Verrucomicrobiota bacterium]
MNRKINIALTRILSHLFLRGDARVCPVCGRGARRFLDFGIVPRADAQCPFCGALERHRLLWLYLSRETSYLEKPPGRVLHIAPEPVFRRRFRKLFGEGYLTGDLRGTHVDENIDITDIQYPDNTFDLILCSHVLEHVPEDRKAMREFHRVLAPEGQAFLLVPINSKVSEEDPSVTDPKDRLRLYGHPDHVRNYGLDYPQRLEEEGFKVKTVLREDFLTDEELENMGVTATSGELYIGRK